MRRQKELNEKTLEKARKEKDRVLYLKEKIKKYSEEIEKIKADNRWMHYLSSDFDKNATEEQRIEFYNEFRDIR